MKKISFANPSRLRDHDDIVILPFVKAQTKSNSPQMCTVVSTSY